MISYTLEQTGLLEGKINFFTEIHQKHYSSAFKMFKNNPIFGVGPKMFRVECKNEKYKVKGFPSYFLELEGHDGNVETKPVNERSYDKLEQTILSNEMRY